MALNPIWKLKYSNRVFQLSSEITMVFHFIISTQTLFNYWYQTYLDYFFLVLSQRQNHCYIMLVSQFFLKK